MPDAVAALEATAGWIGDGIATIINLFNPEIVIVGGLLGEVYAATAPIVHEHIERSGLSAPRSKVRLELPGLGADSVIIGAAELAFAPLLNDPVLTISSVPVD